MCRVVEWGGVRRSCLRAEHGPRTLVSDQPQLDALVHEMYRAGIPYAGGCQEFKKQFILTVLRDLNWNEAKAATSCGPTGTP